MEFDVPKFISNLVENQFPSFYKDEGENFILFAKAYYEWMEDDWGAANDGLGGPVRESRELFEYRDIDLTLEKFLEFFQKKYLYGIPFDVIANKRFLLKHILDVYTSKGTIQGYRLLFKLLYNEDVQIYLPGEDIFKPSDGTWVSPKYLELSANDIIKNYIGKTIIGATSGVTATVETFVNENYNKDIINIVYISNIIPSNKDFEIGEKIVLLEDFNKTDVINEAPSVLGSLDSIEVVNGGQGYNIGDVIKIVYRDVANNNVISYGVDGVLAVTALKTGNGNLNFNITDGGFGYTTNALAFVYKTTANGSGASFSLGSITNARIIQYNTDLLCDYANITLNAASYGLPANTSANATSNIGTALTTQNATFGTIFNLDNVSTGTGYDNNAITFVRSVQLSNPLIGSVSYNTTSNTVTGTSTIFDKIFNYTSELVNGTVSGTSGSSNVTGVGTTFTSLNENDKIRIDSNFYYVNAVTNNTFMQLKTNLSTSPSANVFYIIKYDNIIALKANSSLLSSLEYSVVKDVVSNTEITLYGPPTINSTASAQYRASPTILPSQFAPYETEVIQQNGSVAGENESILASPNFGNNTVATAKAINSGKGYIEGETVKAFLSGGISNTVIILEKGTGYTNNELLIFAGGDPGVVANGYITTNGNGEITTATVTYGGSGYVTVPEVRVRSANGVGASFRAAIQEFNTTAQITATVKKTGTGRGRGYWTTTRSFLSNDKYLQDSYYYQDYSYEIQVAQILNKYKKIINETFHTAGSELFGKYLKFLNSTSNAAITFESANAYVTSTALIYLYASETNFRADSNTVSVDRYYI